MLPAVAAGTRTIAIALPLDEKGVLYVRQSGDQLELAWTYDKHCFLRHQVSREDFIAMLRCHPIEGDGWEIIRTDSRVIELRLEGWIAWVRWTELYSVVPAAWRK